MNDTSSRHALVDAVDRARRHAPFLASALDREPVLAAAFAAGDLPELDGLEPPADGISPARALRLARRRLALTVAIGDLAGLLDLTAVTARLTAFADHALDVAIRTAIAERTPGEAPQGFAAIALGKQGSGELNYSSDIDPIFLFDPATLPRRPREEPVEAAVRVARRVVELLQARDADGYVLRVDLRLRPSPEVTPIALPIEAALSYYESQALAWERAAFIRARACAGDMALGQRFLDAVRPFVWRRSLDFGAIREVQDISHRIRAHHVRGQRLGPGYDLKRGRGGIREVEFHAQILQLVHGGRDPALRAPATRDALSALADAGWMAADEAAELRDAYTLLRTVEHRAQMVDDRQTHLLPQGAALDSLAQLHGLDDGAALIALLQPHVARVAASYDRLAPGDDTRLPIARDDLAAQLARAGFDDAAAAAQRVEDWRSGRYRALRSPAARDAMEAALPGLAQAFGAAPDPAAAWRRLDAILAGLPSAINLFRLLEAQPDLARLLGAILCHAPTLADLLGRHVALLDGLIDASALDAVGSVAELAARMRLGEAGDSYEALLERVRRQVGEARFALGAQIVAGAADPLAVSAAYSRVAEAALQVLGEATVAAFEGAHGRVPDSELVVLALGRFGGGALTHASDLDLIYLFTGDYRVESDGPKPLGAVHYYNRLAQRLTAALSVPTASGSLYQVDTRLRPSGAQGPLVVSLEGFARYQRESAWTWEHMALTRARAVFGSAAARTAAEAVIARVLAGDRPTRDIRAGARSMRADIHRHKPPQGALDVKLLPGGLVDLEFAVHVTQLVHRAGFDPDLGRAIAALAGQGLIDGRLRTAHDVLTRLLVVTRLLAPDTQAPPPATRDLIVQAMGLADWDAVVAQLAATREEVAAAWRQAAGDEP